MLTGGIMAGFVAAALQSCSYVFSRNFVTRHGSPFLLLFYSQLVMSAIGVVMLPLVMPPGLFNSTAFVWPMAACALTYLMGQGCFFRTLREVEASRLSSLLGLKLLILTLLSFLFYRTLPHWQQFAAILICVTAAMLMNWSGGKISLRACFWLFLALTGYSLSDMSIKVLVETIGSGSLVRSSLTAVALSNIFLGLVVLPAMLKIRVRRPLLVAAIPFALCWMGAMIFLFACFATLGAVFGNVIQSSRGLISVAISVALAHYGYSHLEQRVTRTVWLRRGFAALLMAAAIILYSLYR